MNGAERPLVCALRGPVTLITLGVLFALNNFTPYGFGETWPVLLIVFGLLSLMRRASAPATPYPRGPMPMPPPPYQAAPPYTPPPASGGGSYRQSPYGGGAPPAGASEPVKGGFGSSGSQNPGGSK